MDEYTKDHISNKASSFDPVSILGDFLAEADKLNEEQSKAEISEVVAEDESKDAEISLKSFEKEIEEETKKAQEMSEAELDDFIKNIAENGAHKPIEKKTAPYIKEFPSDYVNAFAELAAKENKRYSVPDALISSIFTLGKVNVEYISALSGKTAHEVIDELTATDSIYQNPLTWNEKFSEGWEAANEYLSGTLFLKKKAALSAIEKYGSVFERNVKAIDALYRDKIPSEDIYATLGSIWIPASIYNDWFYKTFGPRYKRKDGIYYDDVIKCWKVTYTIATGYDVPGMSAVEIIERTLNNRPVTIFYKKLDKSQKFRQIDRHATMQAIDSQKKLIEMFRAWIFSDPARKAELEQLYFETYGAITARKFNGSFLELPGKNPEITLYKHQLDAVARIILTPSTLLAHAVGTGKTYIMIAAGMEMKRTGLTKKNMYVVPNSIFSQWEEDFRTLYPSANLFVVKKGMMSPSNREQTLRLIRDGDYDAILISYGSFELIEPGFKGQIGELKDRINQVGNDPKYNSIKMDCIKKIADLEKKRQEHKGLCFEDLGVTSLFVDEAHSFKNVSISLNAAQLGVTRGGAKCADDMYTKVRILRKTKGAKGVVFATGTPLTNSITELFVMQSYLQPEDLKFLKLDTFDNWALTFAETSYNFEIDVDSSHFRMVERINRFHNLPELTNLFAEIADFHLEELSEIFTQTVDYYTIEVPRGEEQTEYVAKLAERTENVRGRMMDREQDNLLKITVDGRKAALDIRLVEPKAQPKTSKVEYCADKVYDIYKTRPEVTQLVFCDNSTPKESFNIYDELKKALLQRGIPSCEIEFIQNAKNGKQKRALFDCVNFGDIKVLIGSTPTLGTGVNVQKKLFAIHHLDVPWKPSEMVQREGRMLRQGNDNDNVEVYRYVTAGSFDSYSWQLLESKQKFICQLLSGSFDERDGDELNELVLTYAEIKALAIGDPKIKERVETSNELDRLKLYKTSMLARREYLGKKLEDLPGIIASKKAYVKALQDDFITVSAYQKGNYKEIGESILKALETPPKKGELKYVNTYRGIDIYLPDSALVALPRVILTGKNQKVINLKNGDGLMLTATGIMQRVDDYYDKMIEYIKENSKLVLEKERELAQVKAELTTEISDIDAEILRMKNHLDELDAALGIEKDD